MKIEIGSTLEGYGGSAALVGGYEDVNLYLGALGKYRHEAIPTASFKVFGVEVIVTEKEIVQEIRELKNEKVKCLKYLQDIFIKYIKQNPEFLTEVNEYHYERGRVDGNRERIRMLKDVLDVNLVE